jgi:transposase
MFVMRDVDGGEGTMDRDSLALLLAQGVSVEEIGRRFNRHPSTVAYWMAKFGLEAPIGENGAATGGIERGRLEELVGEGRTTRQIAAELDVSQPTVRRWLGRYGLRTRQAERREEVRVAREAGKHAINRTCVHHGDTEFVIDYSGCYRCRKCRVAHVTKRRRRVKEILVREAGGRCSVCGYDRYVGALEFHHLDRAAKQLSIAGYGTTVSLEALRTEAKKCVLLCSNCHAEVEAGLVAESLYDWVRSETDPPST